MTHLCRCAHCHLEFVADNTHEDALREARDAGFTEPESEFVSVCDDCYELIMNPQTFQSALPACYLKNFAEE